MEDKNNSILNNRELLNNYVSNCFTYSEVLRKFDLKITGGNLATLKKYISKFDLDIKHFNPKIHNAVKPVRDKIENESIFCINSKYDTKIARRRIIKYKLLKYKCVECGLTDIWNNKPITLQLEHKNGNNRDHRLENLEFLCPNCHSQTGTYGAKNKKSYKNKTSIVKDSVVPFIDNNIDNIVMEILSNKYKNLNEIILSYGMKINSKKKVYLKKKLKNLKNEHVNGFLEKFEIKKVKYPEPQKVLEMLKEKSFVQVGREIGCSDNAIRKYLRKNNLL